MSSNFRKDLNFGMKYEREALIYFTHKEYIFNNDYKYDILFDDNLKVEVKSDRLAYKTNNICIEYMYKNKPSGITKTEASIYIYFIIKPDNTYSLYKIPVDILKEFIENKQYIKDLKTGEGAMSYLFNLSVFSDYIVSIN